MAKSETKGIYSTQRNGTTYWYAWTGGYRVYCGKDGEGEKRAIAARAKDVARRYENKDADAGLKVKKNAFRTFTELCNWYMQLDSVQ